MEAFFHDLGDLFRAGLGAQLTDFVQHFGADFVAGNLDERSQMSQADALPAVLVAGYLRDDLGGDIAGGGEAMGLLNPGLADHGAVLQHILQIDQIAVVHVLCEIVGVVEMDDALLVRLHDVGGQQQTLGPDPC